MPYEHRTYRALVEAEGLVSFRVKVGETDLQILAGRDLSDVARKLARKARRDIKDYAKGDDDFIEALEPRDVGEEAPSIVKAMAHAGAAAGVGPMAAVAGAIAQRVGDGLLSRSPQVIVENGGDIFMSLTGTSRARRVAVFAGASSLSMKLVLEIEPGETPLGVAASSATVGPSVSFGKADAAVVTSPDAALADAVATALGNRVRARGDLEPALAWALTVEGVRGALVVLGDAFAAQGEIRLAPGPKE